MTQVGRGNEGLTLLASSFRSHCCGGNAVVDAQGEVETRLFVGDASVFWGPRFFLPISRLNQKF